MSPFRTLDQADLRGKRVLVRVDLNVPVADGKVTDDTRIRAVAPTILEIADKGGKAILLAHFGRPVAFAEASVGETAEKAVATLRHGGILLLENTRFEKGEEKNDPAYAKA